MKSEGSAWAFLRPLLLGVAVAASWITLSAVGASADSSSSSHPLLGAAPSTVGSVAARVTHQAKDVLEPVKAGADGLAVAPASTIPNRTAAPALHPVAEGVPALADAVLEPLALVLEPVIDAAPLPAPTPVAPGPTSVEPALPAVVDVPQAADAVRAPMANPEGETADAATASARPLNRISHGNGLACDSRTKPAAGTPLPAGAGPQDAPPGGPSDALPGTPGAATGGSSPSGGNGSATPARLGAHNLQVPGAGIAPVQGGPPAAPAPVSSDPGSSPD